MYTSTIIRVYKMVGRRRGTPGYAAGCIKAAPGSETDGVTTALSVSDVWKVGSVRGCRDRGMSLSLPLLQQLQWLPVEYRNKFKLATVTCRTHSTHI